MNPAAPASFREVTSCWICEGPDLRPVHELVFELSAYERQDPDLAAYSGSRIALRRCRGCGFAQPALLPALPGYFDRMYDQRWAPGWVRSEFDAADKDGIFRAILERLSRLLPGTRRRLLDVGAHAGRFIWLAQTAGWSAEGLELNPTTAAYAATRTGATIRQVNIHDAELPREAYDAVTMTDVLEHIPHPVTALARARALLSPGGWIAVKVPCGPNQLRKERWRGRLRPGYRPTVADNLVHVSHFSPRSLRQALARAGFEAIAVRPAAPELRPGDSRAARLALHRVACALPGGVHTPITFNLQAYGRRR